MYIFQKHKDVETFLSDKSKTVGFVPTMGALHQGHISLIEKSKSENEITVCSIFINPTQFNNTEDFNKYPVTIEKDIQMLLAVQCDVLFLPSVKEMYPQGTQFKHQFDLGALDTILEGSYRPGHFAGVSFIVNRLLQIVKPRRLYMGEKDFQQCMIIKQLLEQTQSDVQLITCPTLREEYGLAMSSRNMRLNTAERTLASNIFHALMGIKARQFSMSFEQLKNEAIATLQKMGFAVEYINLADADTFELLHDFDSNKNQVVLIAAFLNGVRLIDNIRL